MRPRKELSRDVALSGRPEQAPAVRREERENGGLRVTVRFVSRHFLARWFHGSGEIERSYGLDVLGREVYEACDGRTSVKTMVGNFARKHKVSKAEAELSVTAFLKTMIARGLVVVAVDKDRVGLGRGDGRVR